MEGDESVRAACAEWLETVLFPMALRAAPMKPVTPADALATLRRRPDARSFLEGSAKGYWNAREAEQLCEDLGIVDAAIVVAYWAGDVPRARDARDAIVLLSHLAGFERSIASELHQDVSDALYPHGDDPQAAGRALVADKAFERLRALDGPVGEALLDLIRRLGAVLR